MRVMRPSSCKGKGRRLQNWFAGKIREAFPGLTERDVRPTTMGDTGADVKLSERAFEQFPFAVECKNVEKINVWNAMEQARGHAAATGGAPVAILSRNREKHPIAVMHVETFLKLARIRNWAADKAIDVVLDESAPSD